jgi:hypothetical protein
MLPVLGVLLFSLLMVVSCSRIYDNLFIPAAEKSEYSQEESKIKQPEYSEEFIEEPQVSSSKENSSTPDTEEAGILDNGDTETQTIDTVNYIILSEEEENFYNDLQSLFPDESMDEFIAYMNDIEENYPKGYFIIIKSALNTDYYWFEELIDISGGKIKSTDPEFHNDSFPLVEIMVTMVHEYTHEASGDTTYQGIFDIQEDGYVYLIDNFGVFIDTDRMLFDKVEVYEDIANPDDFDDTYMSPVEGNIDIDLMIIMDEINAYNRDVEYKLALEEFVSDDYSDSTRFGLLKQMMYLELYLKRAYEKHPEDWEYIINKKGLSFFIMKLWMEAEKLENTVKDDYRFNMDSEEVAEFIYSDENYWIMDRLFTDSGIKEFIHLDFIDESFTDMEIYPVP